MQFIPSVQDGLFTNRFQLHPVGNLTRPTIQTCLFSTIDQVSQILSLIWEKGVGDKGVYKQRQIIEIEEEGNWLSLIRELCLAFVADRYP